MYYSYSLGLSVTVRVVVLEVTGGGLEVTVRFTNTNAGPKGLLITTLPDYLYIWLLKECSWNEGKVNSLCSN